MSAETMAQYVERHRITVEIERDRGAQIEDGWEHHAYVLKLTHGTGATLTTPWKQGHGIEDSPTDRPDSVLDTLVSDAYNSGESFEDWCADYGYDEDSRKAYATWEQCQGIETALTAFLGGADELDYLAQKVERL